MNRLIVQAITNNIIISLFIADTIKISSLYIYLYLYIYIYIYIYICNIYIYIYIYMQLKVRKKTKVAGTQSFM